MTVAPPRAARLSPQLLSRVIRYGLIGALALGGVLLFVLTSASSNSRAFERNYPILLAANGAIALVLFVLVAALALRLVRRVRAGRFGARLMARFAIAFALMGVVPGVLVYAVSSQFLLRSIESWFNVEVEGALESGLALGRAVLETQRDDLKAKARAMAQELADAPALEHPRVLERLRERVGIEQATILSASGALVWSSSAPGLTLAPAMPGPSVLRSTLAAGGYAVIEGDALSVEPGRGLRTRAIVPIPFSSSARSFGSMSLADALPRSGPLRAPAAERIRIEEPHFLQLTQSVAPAVAANAQALQAGYGQYQQLSLARSGLQSIYRLTLTLTLLLAVFAAIASGVLLAASMTAPLVELAAGTKAVAEGDYRPVREFSGNDELNLLPQSFNAMTRQLAEARDAVETRSRQLDRARLPGAAAGQSFGRGHRAGPGICHRHCQLRRRAHPGRAPGHARRACPGGRVSAAGPAPVERLSRSGLGGDPQGFVATAAATEPRRRRRRCRTAGPARARLAPAARGRPGLCRRVRRHHADHFGPARRGLGRGGAAAGP